MTIGDDEATVEVEDVARGEVDDRLKMIQMEDNSNNSGDDTFVPELEEKVKLPHQKRKTIGDSDADDEVVILEKPQTQIQQDKPVVQNSASQPPTQASPQVSAKVVVGYYATSAQAEVAKGIIQDAGLNVQPFVKNIGSAYTLQVGSFNSKEKAQSVANELLRNNFPARVIVE